mmetsp:Transcript_47581/g.92896  ORF Transcript_47581/g.92896 Transcript_47581/m.92896 type:complete len:662 (-) Transcript_47581:259-2244(-)
MKLYLALLGLTPVDATVSCYKGNIFYFDHSPYPKERACNIDYPVFDSFDVSQTKPNMDCIRASHVEAARFYKDGFLKIDDASGMVDGVSYDDTDCDYVKDYSGKLITPGFLDCHNHWPQIDMIASFGGDLIEWLKTYTFKAEARNINPEYAKASAKRFFNILARSGTTSTLALSVIFKDAVSEFFKEANARNVRMVSGLNAMSDCGDSEYPVMIDKNLDGVLVEAPLCNSLDFEDVDGTKSAAKFLEDSEALIEMYYNNPDQRSEYAIMPRFLLSSTPPMMEACKTLRLKYPDMKFHTHMAENLGTSVYSVFEFIEEAEVHYGVGGKQPDADFLALLKTKKTKFEIWDAYGLVDAKSSWGHSIHMTENDLKLAKDQGATQCHCPTSNLFLGSGLFDMQTYIEMDIKVGMGSDVGAGTSYEMLRVMGDMYKVAMTSGSEAASIPAGTKGEFNDFYLGWLGRPATLEEKANGFDYPWGGSYPGYSIQGTGDERTTIPYKRTYKPYPLSQLYLMTLATAGVMGIDDKVGSFKEGMEADFVVTDMDFSPIYNWNKKVTEDFLMEDLSKEAEESLAAFKTYSNSDLAHVGTKLDDYFWLEKAFFPLIVLSDDRTTFATYIMGKQAYDRELHYHLSLDDDYTFPMRGTKKGAKKGAKKSKGSTALPY